MQVKRFVAANMRSALKMVREEMGPDAVILSNKRVAEGVELLISLDGELHEAPESTPASHSDNPFQQAISDSELAANPIAAARAAAVSDLKQQQARQQAEKLAALLARKNQQQLADAVTAVAAEKPSTQPAELNDDVAAFSQSIEIQLQQAAAITEAAAVAQAGGELPAQSSQQQSAPVSAADQQQLSDMRDELQSMRDLLEQQFKSMAWTSFSQQNPKQASFWKRLKRMGMGASVVEPLLANRQLDRPDSKQTGIDSWQQIMQQLAAQLPVVQHDLIDKGGVFAFVGPTGAGKTTTIGKLAARYVLSHGADDIALVTTDTMRIAAHEQLRTFGRILNIPVKIVDKNNSLERVLYSLRHKALVLIDTAGLNRQDPRLGRQIDSLNEAGARLRTLLVVPTTSQVAVIKSAFYSYKTDNLSGCVLTKLDESSSLGEVMTLAIDKSLPIAYTTDGQGIPDDIAVADSTELLQSAIKLARNTGTDEQTMADEFSGTVR
jgi:flagellar biosynthesis protein FlhF